MVENSLGHPGGEKARRDGVDVDVVLRPLVGQRAGEVHHTALAGVIGECRRHFRIETRQALDRRDVDDLALPARHHAAPAHFLRDDKHGREIQIDDLVPRFQRVVYRRGTPGRAGVVDENVDRPECGDNAFDHRRNGSEVRHVADHRQRLDPQGLQVFCRFLQFLRLTRRDGHLGAQFAHRFRHLQAQTARPAGHQRGAARQVKEFFQAHGEFSSNQIS